MADVFRTIWSRLLSVFGHDKHIMVMKVVLLVPGYLVL
jgi:hypothetical protein